MSTLAEFLEQLLHSGRVTFAAPPSPGHAQMADAQRVLERAFAVQARTLAGPALPFQPRVALACAELVRQSCWFLVRHDEPVGTVLQRLELPPPASAADHWTGDLLLRYLPQIYRRARALAPADPFGDVLAQRLREWPLSGVLGDVADAPVPPPELDGHPGLLLLYAERLVKHPKPGWLPAGRGREYVELVCRELGAPGAVLLQRLLPPERVENTADAQS